MRKGQKLSMGTRRWQATQERKLLRQFYEFQKNSRQKNRPKRLSNKYSYDDSFTKILKTLWKMISKIFRIS
jgi:hypothetical protein